MAQVLCIARARLGGIIAGLHAEKQRQHGHGHQDGAHPNDVAHVAVHNADVDDFSHHQRNQDLHQDLQNNKNRGQDGLFFKFTYRLK